MIDGPSFFFSFFRNVEAKCIVAYALDDISCKTRNRHLVVALQGGIVEQDFVKSKELIKFEAANELAAVVLEPIQLRQSRLPSDIPIMVLLIEW